jgi:2'-5' RNA ligase
MRSFVAIPLQADCHTLLKTLQEHLRTASADVRWTAVASIHLTLKFLGEIDPSAVGELAGSFRAIAASQDVFSLRIGGLGAFPGPRNPRVVWCGVQGDLQQLRSLQKRVDEACALLGFPAEGREYQPHLTLGRVRSGRNLQRLGECIRIAPDLRCGLQADRFNIYRSTLRPSGAVYDVLESYTLRAREGK